MKVDSRDDAMSDSGERVLGRVDAIAFQRYAVAVGDMNAIYFDDAAARAAGYPGIVAPPNYLTAVVEWGAGPTEAEMREDGNDERNIAKQLSGLSAEQLQGLRMMGGGQEIEFGQYVHPGDVVKYRRRLVEIYERDSKIGVLTFAVHESVYTNQDGALLAICRETNIGSK
jgi:acyl dehydratase